MATVEVWIADPRGSYRAKGLKVVTLTALHDVESHAIRYDTTRSGVDAIVYTVDASSLMWTALLMDRGFGLYNAPKPMRIPGDGASQLVKDFLPRCLSPTGRSQATSAQAAAITKGGGAVAGRDSAVPRRPSDDPNTMPDVVARELTALYKRCKRPNVGQGFVNHHDVNGDGRPDWYLDFVHYDCDGARDFCGSGGCSFKLSASTRGDYKKVYDETVYSVSFSSVGGQRRMTADLHGSLCGKAGPAPCRNVMVWNGEDFVVVKTETGKPEAAVIQVSARQKPSSPGWCWGTFLRRSCMLGGNECAYPREKGHREEFMGWEDDDGVRGYAVYRLGAYRAADI